MNPQNSEHSVPVSAPALSVRLRPDSRRSSVQEPQSASILRIPASQWYRTGALFGQTPAASMTLAPSERAANYDPRISPSTYFVHGITWGKPEHQLVSDHYGCPTTMIVNDQDRSIIIDAKNTISGMISSDWGREAEPEAVAKTMRVLRKSLHDKRPLRLLVFSQGAVIASNALFELKKELNEAEWEQLSERVHVQAFGSAMHEWPEDIHVEEFVHSGDSVATYSGWFAAGKEKFEQASEDIEMGVEKLSAWWNGEDAKESPAESRKQLRADKVVEIPYRGDDAHSAAAYMRHLPDFFVAGHTDADGRINEEELAVALARSISTAAYSDFVHQEVLGQMVDSAAFRRKFKTEAEKLGLKDFKIKDKVLSASISS